jgi:hypothetical protein
VRSGERQDYRNGYYTRDFVTKFGTLRLGVARTRKRGFLPEIVAKFQRRAEEVTLLIREAFLRGISTRQTGRVVATLTGEAVSPQTVSRITRSLDEVVKQFHQARLKDDYAFLFLDGVSLRMRRPAGRKRVHMLVAYGVRQDGTRHRLAFLRSRGESQSDWEGLLEDLYRRGLEGKKLLLIVTDGCPGLAARDPDRLPAGRSSTPLGPQDAKHFRARAPTRLRPGETGSAIHLSRRQPEPGASRFSPLPGALAARLRPDGPAPRARSAGTAFVLQLTQAFMEEGAHHQRHRTLLRGSSPKNPAHGLLRQRGQRRPHHLLHLPEIQPGMEKPHP